MSKRASRSNKGAFRRHCTLENVIVEETFTFNQRQHQHNPSDIDAKHNSDDNDTDRKVDDQDAVGHGCYISCTTTSQGSKRYYGVLVEQSALMAASELFLSDEASSLELNRRMEVLLDQKKKSQNLNESVPSASSDVDCLTSKQMKPTCHDENKECPGLEPVDAKLTFLQQPIDVKKVEQFKYMPRQSSHQPGYRTLIATYSDIEAASQFHPENMKLIGDACESGGNWVGSFYYQYQVAYATLVPSSTKLETQKKARERQIDIHTSMGLHSFLHNTLLPDYYPLSNTGGIRRQSNVLNMFQPQVKRSIRNYNNLSKKRYLSDISTEEHEVTGSRNAYKIAIIGGGIAGFSCAYQLLQDAIKRDISIEVKLFEARSRIGGRIVSDEDSFKWNESQDAIPVDLGAQFIHGTNENPLLDICSSAKLNLLTNGEKMKLLGGRMVEIDDFTSNKTESMFNDLLDNVVSDVWNRGDTLKEKDTRNQHAIRWYASVFSQEKDSKIEMTDVPKHRYSSDGTFEYAVGEELYNLMRNNEDIAVNRTMLDLLQWESKNLEYELGANIDSLSIKYFNSDEEYAFDGAYAQVSEGYAEIVSHIEQECKKYKNFSYSLSTPVRKISYSRNATSYPMFRKDRKKAIDIADACQILLQDGQEEEFDFTVCTVPLGVLKECVSDKNKTSSSTLQFEPPLPPSKVDAIKYTGFGLLNKVFLEFEEAFWRIEEKSLLRTPFLSPSENAFANTTKTFPEYFVFKDIGRMKFPNHSKPPAILMTMVSGRAAVKIEQMPEDNVVSDIMTTLRELYSDLNISGPRKVKITRWGADEFARGCYTFMPPGCNDQDYVELAKPLSGVPNVEQIEASATFSEELPIYRLFFAGEHTTESHPSTAHGAYLSGQESAKSLLNEVFLKNMSDAVMDEHISLSSYRLKFPMDSLQCQLCGLKGNRKREGDLYGFRRGTKYAIAHYHCASFCPAVNYGKSGWKNIISEVQRGRYIKCTLCRRSGASIGCSNEACLRSYHYTCAQLAGWNFMRRGRGFYCGIHQHEGASSMSDSSDATDTEEKKTLNPVFSSPMRQTQGINNNLQHVLFNTAQSSASRDRLTLSFWDSSEFDSDRGTSESMSPEPRDDGQNDLTRLLSCNGYENINLSSSDIAEEISRTHPILAEVELCRISENNTWGLFMELRTEPIDEHKEKQRTSLEIYAFDEQHGDLLQSSDIILRINDTVVGSPALTSWRQVIQLVENENNKSLKLTVARKKTIGKYSI